MIPEDRLRPSPELKTVIQDVIDYVYEKTCSDCFRGGHDRPTLDDVLLELDMRS